MSNISNMWIGIFILIIVSLVINKQYKIPAHLPIAIIAVYIVLTDGKGSISVPDKVIPNVSNINQNMIHTDLPDF